MITGRSASARSLATRAESVGVGRAAGTAAGPLAQGVGRARSKNWSTGMSTKHGPRGALAAAARDGGDLGADVAGLVRPSPPAS